VNKLTDKDMDDLFGNNLKIEPPEKLKQLIECFPAISKELKRK
jgi:hypothetical protein